MSFLRPLRSFIRIFQRLFGMLVSGLVIFLPVVRGGSTVRVCGKFVVFGSFMVRVNWHSASNPRWSPQLRIFPFSKLFNCEHSRRPASAACLINAQTGQVEIGPILNVRLCD
jgi:hypothetical protein